MRHVLWLTLLVAAAAAQETVSDDWFVLRMDGGDVGYLRTRVVRREDVLETTNESKLTLMRLGAEMVVELSEIVEERASDGALLRLRSKSKLSAEEMETVVRFEGLKAILVTTAMGQKHESTMDCPEGLVGPRRIEQLMREAKPGGTVEAKTFLGDLKAVVTLRITGGAEEEVPLLDGKRERLRRVEAPCKEMPVKTATWFDAAGKARRTVQGVGTIEMEMCLATEERARRAGLGGDAPRPEALVPTLLPAPHAIPRPRRLDRATYVVRAKEGMPAFADDRQSVAKQEDGSVILRIERRVPPEGRTGKRPLGKPSAELLPSLASNPMVQSDAPEITAIAREVVGSEPDAWKAAQKLERWVKGNITSKDLDIGFASALEVARDRRGDCTEHAVLLCALCRAAGIPARVAMGMIAMGGAWIGHAWSEVWIDGRWYAIDGTLGQGSVDPAHITLSRMTLKDTSFAAEFIGVMQGLGNLEIDATEVVLEGRALRPGDETARVEGFRYENPLWGIGFTRPRGWTLDTTVAAPVLMSLLAKLDGEAGGMIVVGAVDADEGDWETMKTSVGKSGDAVEERKVAGRPALRVTPKGGGARVFALGPDALYIFEADAMADPAALEALLASVDYGVK